MITNVSERPISRSFGIVFPDADGMAKLRPADQQIARLLALEAGVRAPIAAEPVGAEAERPTDVADPQATVRPIGADDIDIGRTSKGEPVGLDLTKLIDGRLLIQGNSGAGKSMLLRRLFEQAFGRVQQLLIDPDGEFATLREYFDVAVFTADDIGRVGGKAFAAHLREHRYSAVLDLSDATSEDRMSVVADLAEGLMETPDQHWHPLLVLIDEAQTLAPHYDTGDVMADTRKRSTAALADIMGRGRKRGIAGVIATQRLAETSKAVVSKATNVVVGRTIFDRDMERAGVLLGFTLGHSRALRTLEDGEFLGVGPAIAGPRRVRFRAGPVRSRHKGAAPELIAPPAISATDAAALLAAVPDIEGAASDEAMRSGVRGRGWDVREDDIVRAGYAETLPVRDIQARLEAAGFRMRSISGISTRARDLGFVSPRAVVRFSEEEDEIIRDGYERELKIMEIAAVLEERGLARSRVSIQMRAINLGLTQDRVNYWTPAETKIATEGLQAGKTHREVLQDLRDAGFHRGDTAIFKFAKKHNICRPVDPWTHEEIEILRQRYEAKVSVRDISVELGKTIGGIRSKASLLGFRQRTAWTPEEYELLRAACENGERLIDVAARIGRPYPNVARQAAVLGLSFKAGRGIVGEGA